MYLDVRKCAFVKYLKFKSCSFHVVDVCKKKGTKTMWHACMEHMTSEGFMSSSMQGTNNVGL